MAPYPVIKAVLDPASISVPCSLDSQSPKEWYRQVTTPQPSKTADKKLAAIQSERQRYQRRSQFPPKSESKITKKKAASATVSTQLLSQKVIVGRADCQRTDPKVKEKQRRKRLVQAWAGNWERKSSDPGRKEPPAKIARQFLESILADSVAPPQRPEKIKELIANGIANRATPIIANWICPRGTDLSFDEETERVYRRYTTTEPEEGFETDYQILPRMSLERKLCRKLSRFGTNAIYVKFVADDNPFCLYPACLRIDGVTETISAIRNYSQYCQTRFDELIRNGFLLVTTWSECLGPELFEEYLDTFETTSIESLVPYIPQDSLSDMLNVLTDHTKPDPSVMPYFERFAKDCIRYFAVEGLFLYKLFGDEVILAWNDSTRIASTIDGLRVKEGLPPLPKFYVLHEQRDGKIVNNY